MKTCTVLLSLCLIGVAFSNETASGNKALAAVLEQLGVETAFAELSPAPIPGFLEVTRGTQVLYVSNDGSMLIDGDILALDSESNLTELARARVRRGMLASVPRGSRIVAPATGTPRARITVFVDTDCPYCLKLHRDAAEFAARGIEVDYLFFPRSGPGGDTWSQAESVWCAEDRSAALKAALGGAVLSNPACANPVGAHYELAKKLELKGTPAVVTESGRLYYGAVSADDILGGR